MRVTWMDLTASFSHASLALPLLHAARGGTLADAVEWSRVSATAAEAPGALAARVAATRPDVVAATLYLFNHEASLRALRRVHALLPACRVVLGGPEFLGPNERFLRREPAVSAVLRGEGEEGFAAWLAVLGVPERWEDVPGLCWLDGAGGYRDNGLARVPEARLAALPPAESSPFFPWEGPFVPLETSRGCPCRCTFCCSARTGPPRWLPLPRVRAFLAEARRRGVREVRVLDRTFNAAPGPAVERLRLFLEEFGDIRFHLEIHPAFLPEPLRRLLSGAPPGSLHLEAGLQTTHAGALAAVERAGGSEAAWEGLQFLCALRNLAVHVDLLAGLPAVGFPELLADVTRVAALGPAEIQVETLKVLPGTPLGEQAADLGLVFAPDPPYEVLRTPLFPETDLLRAAALSAILDQYYNAPALGAVFREACIGAGLLPGFLAAQAGPPAGGLSLETRFRCLHAFLAGAAVTGARQVERAWLEAGLSPLQGPGRVRPWKESIPDGAARVAGRVPDQGTAGCRVYLLEQGEVRYWYLFDRARERRQPVAVYRAP